MMSTHSGLRMLLTFRLIPHQLPPPIRSHFPPLQISWQQQQQQQQPQQHQRQRQQRQQWQRQIQQKTVPALSGSVSMRSAAASAPRRRIASAADHQYCLDQVKKYDFDNYLCTLQLGQSVSVRANMAVRAFNVELVTAADSARDPAAALMRTSWWRNVVHSIYRGEAQQSPVARCLAEAVERCQLSQSWLVRLVRRRELDLAGAQPRTQAELELFAEETAASLLYLAIESLGLKAVSADHPASHVGKALGICTILRGSRFHFQQRRLYLPMDLTIKHGISSEQLFRGENPTSLSDVVYDVASLSKLHLDSARKLIAAPEFPRKAFPALLPAVFCEDYLERLRQCDFNLFDEKLNTQSAWTHAKLIKAKYLGRF